MTHGFLRAGIPVTAGIDIDPTCEFAFAHNNAPAEFIRADVAEFPASRLVRLFPPNAIRVLVGCAPCQPFSTYSYKYRSGPRRRDKRWQLLEAFGAAVAKVKPEIVSMENVTELATTRHPAYAAFVRGLAEHGYHVSAKLVKCADYGVPQTRERLVLLASLLGPIAMIPPTHTPRRYVTVRKAIAAMPPLEAGGSAGRDPLHRACSLSALNLRRIRATPEGGGWQDWPKALRAACHRRASGSTYPSVYGRMRWDDLAPTLTTQCYGLGNGRFGHPEQDRAISLREAAVIQTFPSEYEFVSPDEEITFKHVGRHIGNAVPVRLGEAIAASIMTHVA